MSKKPKYVWVVEMLTPNGWEPCASAALTRRDGQREIRDYWRANDPDDKFRLARYVKGGAQ